MSCTCPECGHSSDISDFDQDEENFAPDLDGVLVCPECDYAWEAE